MPNRRRILSGAALLGAALVEGRGARADAWPSRPIRAIVPYAPGGSTDISARLLLERVAATFPQRFVVENRPGAAGNIGLQAGVQAAPDGYTIVVATTGHAINATLYKDPTFHGLRSLVPVGLLTENPLMVVVNPAVPARTIAELVAYAKARPGALNFASSGSGSSTHLAAELFASMAGIRLTHVPYRGSAPGITDLIAGNVQMAVDTTQSALPHVADGRIRALGITSRERLALVPDVPTVAEAGLPGYEAIAWNGLLMPPGTPRAMVEVLNRELVKAAVDPGITARLRDLGAGSRPMTPDAFGTFVAAEIDKWAEVVRASGARAE